MNSFLSLHLLADGCNDTDINRAGEFLARCNCEFYNITTASRYDEAEKLIRQIKRIAPNCRALWRGWPKKELEDGGIFLRVTPQEWINYRIKPNAAWLDELDVYTVTCNEVGVLGSDARRWSAWEAACIKMAWEEYQVRLAVMRFSTGNPLETEHENYDDALSAAGEYRAIITPNQYTAVDGRLSTDHHIGRHKWLWTQQDKLGVERSKIVIGEYALCRFDGNNKPDPYHGYDDMNINIGQHLNILKRDGVIYQADHITACWFVAGHWQEGGGSFDVHNNEALLLAVETEAKAGNLDMIVNTIQNGRLYHIATNEAEIPVYLTPAIDPTQVIGKIPNDAIVVAGNAVRIGSDTFIQVKYPSFKGQGWIVKPYSMKFTETTTMPVFKDEDPTKVVTKPLPEPPHVETPPAKPDVSAGGETPAGTPKMGFSLTLAQIADFEAFRSEFQTALKSHEAQIKNSTAEIEKYTNWITAIDVVLSQVKETA